MIASASFGFAASVFSACARSASSFCCWESVGGIISGLPDSEVASGLLRGGQRRDAGDHQRRRERRHRRSRAGP